MVTQDAEGQIMGPLINARQRDRVLGYIERGKAEGARLLLGGVGRRISPEATMWSRTVFVDVANDMTIAREEVFGPVPGGYCLRRRGGRHPHRQ